MYVTPLKYLFYSIFSICNYNGNRKHIIFENFTVHEIQLHDRWADREVLVIRFYPLGTEPLKSYLCNDGLRIQSVNYSTIHAMGIIEGDNGNKVQDNK